MVFVGKLVLEVIVVLLFVLTWRESYRKSFRQFVMEKALKYISFITVGCTLGALVGSAIVWFLL